MRSGFVILLLICSLTASGNVAKTDLPTLPLNENLLKADLGRILSEGKLPKDLVTFEFKDGPSAIKVECSQKEVILKVTSSSEEKAGSLYKGLRELGFYFPHPMKQISPSLSEIKKKCGETFHWRPALKYRGFHLHTLHPNEWVSGFFGENPLVADALVRWLARNNQNLLDVSLLRIPLSQIAQKFKPHLDLARGLQIHTGVSLGIALQQQKSFKLLTILESILGLGADDKIKTGLENILTAIPLSFVVLEAGTSEFTPTNFEKTLHWLNLAGEISKRNKVSLFTKIHVSSNQHSERWGNFNFLPQHASKNVGILPHTVMFYGLEDDKAPMYGNKNFHGIKEFTLKEKSNRPTWYYPETSYWVGMDMDIPLLLTDYLVARAKDMKWLINQGIEGQLNFTSGHALGYWLMDWNLALLTDSDYKHYPALEFLKEDLSTWNEILTYQTHWYKEKGLIALLSSANLQDEISSSHRIHERFTMRDLSNSPEEVQKEIHLLEESLKSYPDISKVINQELKSLLSINYLRAQHALMLRLALKHPDTKTRHLERAEIIRKEAKEILTGLTALPTNYPGLPLFTKWKNPTSYQFGYVYPAATLYFWEREERQIKDDSYFPFWNNLYSVWGILF